MLSLDADPGVVDPQIASVHFRNVAIGDEPGERTFYLRNNPEARGFGAGDENCPTVRVPVMTVSQLLADRAIDMFDLVKLDVEGAEYEVLASWPGPIARQISIEFHDHCRPRAQSVYDAVIEHLSQWYDVVRHERDERYCAGPNYWDTLLALRQTA